MSDALIGLFPDLLPIGGVQVVCRHTAAVLSRIAVERGWQTHFLSLNDPAGSHEAGVDITNFQFRGFGRSKVRFTIEAMKLARPDAHIVLAAHPNLTVPAFAMRTKSPGLHFVAMSHGVDVWQPLNRLRRIGVRAADCVLVPSRDTADKLRDVQRIPSERIRLLPLGLDPEFLDLACTPKELPLPDSVPRGRYVLAVGRWSSAERYKGFDTLIQALPQIRDVTGDVNLVFAGDGDDRLALEELATRFHVRDSVRFISGLTRPQLVSVYRHADVFALPSGGEGFGIVYLEAMALGRPVVGGNHGGVPDVVEDGVTGFLVQHGNVSQLVERLTLLLRNSGLAGEMGRRGHERVLRQFSFGKFEAGLRAILGEIDPSIVRKSG